ncbi:MAG: hypothetical protein K2L00_00110, partial [Muribaculaceae bacterium]|nr:hypothetical protein [Muribaculaceae bacterium]
AQNHNVFLRLSACSTDKVGERNSSAPKNPSEHVFYILNQLELGGGLQDSAEVANFAGVSWPYAEATCKND